MVNLLKWYAILLGALQFFLISIDFYFVHKIINSPPQLYFANGLSMQPIGDAFYHYKFLDYIEKTSILVNVSFACIFILCIICVMYASFSSILNRRNQTLKDEAKIFLSRSLKVLGLLFVCLCIYYPIKASFDYYSCVPTLGCHNDRGLVPIRGVPNMAP